MVLGTRNRTQPVDTFTPRVIVAAPAAYARENVLIGRIASASNKQLTLTTAAGSKTVTLANDVQAFGARLTPSAVKDLPANAPALILGEPVSADTFNARVLFTLPKPQTNPLLNLARLNTAFGTVTTTDGTKLEIQPAPPPARTLTLDANTKIIVVGKPNATAGDIQAGDKILALGVKAQNRTGGTPRAVLVAPAAYTRANVRLGRVISVQADQLTLKTPNEQLTLALNAETQIFDQNLNPLASDALENQGVLVIGRVANGVMQAQVILARIKP
ncbi:MAG: hypothetical protein HY741_00240 [Chloroflexi bacterium]|nr:hypothetical protein [Chloroflexota bacterium]